MKQIFTTKKKKKHLMKKSTFQQYFHCFVVGMLVPYFIYFIYLFITFFRVDKIK